MTIAEKLYVSDPDTLFKLIVQYQLVDLAILYFPDKVIIRRKFPDDLKVYEDLMRLSAYSGKVERKRRAITQRHKTVFK